MWTNKASRIEVPPYAPPLAPRKTDATAAIHVLKETPPLAVPARPGSRLGPGLRIKGEISGAENLTVDGAIDGLIQLEGGKLTVGAGARIAADILAAEIVVYGEVKGNLCARDRIEVKKDGSVVGELRTSRIMIEDGAYFKGSIEIDRKAAAANGHPVGLSSEVPLPIARPADE
jgi:cytoskeletal protein CcmA (bactofilin family)